MKLLVILLNAISIWLMADPAYADPITAAIGAIAKFALGSVIGKLLVGVAINFGVSLISKALQKKSNTQTQSGVKLQVSMGDDQPMSFTLGNYATAGRRKYIGTWGEDGKTPNAYLTDVVELGNLPVAALNGFFADDRKCTILWGEPAADGRGYPVSEYRVSGKDYLWIKFVDGTQTTPDAFVRAKFGSNADRPFKATMIGYGCPYVVVTARYNTDLFSGLPNWLFEVGSIKLYDVRKDSTNGGSGSHRWTDRSTWEPSLNPVVMIYNLVRGVYYGSDWLYGGQNLAAFSLPSSSFIAGANACDIAVSLSGGGTEPSYRAGYEVHCDQPALDTINEIMKAANARMAEVGGIFKILVGVPGAAVYSFSDVDIIVTREQDYQPFPQLSDTYNALEATYPEPLEKWATKDAPGRYYPDLETADGGRRLPVQVELPAAPYPNQVQRVGQAMILDYRRFRTHQFHLPPDAYPLEPNDCVAWSSTRNGYANKKFLVVKAVPQSNFLVLVTLKEIDPSDYDWNLSQQLPTGTGWIGPITPPPQPMYGWTVEPATLNNSAGQPWRPSIKISCASDQDDVAKVWVQVRLAATGEIVFDSDSTRYASPYSWVINASFKSNTNHEARGRFIPISSRLTDWSAWLPVTTPTVLIGSDEIYLDGVVDGLHNFVSDATSWVRDGTRQSILDAQRIARLTVDQDLGTFADRQLMRTQYASSLNTAVAQLTASYQSDIVLATGPGSALAQRIDQLSSSLTDTQTNVSANAIAIFNLTTTVTQIGNDLTAASQQITTITSRIDDPATGLIANANATSSLTTRVTNAEGSITSISQQLSTVTAAINDPSTGLQANADATTLLSARVDSVNGQLSAQADAITSLNAQVGDISASANFRMSVYAAPSGYSSRIGMEARGGSSGAYRSASAFLDVPSSAGSPTRFAVVADQFSVTNGSSYQNPFIFQGGIAYLNSIKVNWADIVNASIGTAQIQDGAITNAKIGNLTVQTSNLDFNQITDAASNVRTGTTPAGNESVVGATWTINNQNPNPVLTSYFFTFTVQGAGSGGTTVRVRLVNDTTGQEIAGLTITVPSSGSSRTDSLQGMVIEPRPGAQGNYQYSIRGQAGAQAITARIDQLWWKR